jgi:hypothetical protein
MRRDRLLPRVAPRSPIVTYSIQHSCLFQSCYAVKQALKEAGLLSPIVTYSIPASFRACFLYALKALGPPVLEEALPSRMTLNTLKRGSPEYEALNYQCMRP